MRGSLELSELRCHVSKECAIVRVSRGVHREWEFGAQVRPRVLTRRGGDSLVIDGAEGVH